MTAAKGFVVPTGGEVTLRGRPPCHLSTDWLFSLSISARNCACTGARDSAMTRFELLSGPERRRRWSEEQKWAVVAALRQRLRRARLLVRWRAGWMFAPGRSIAGVRSCAAAAPWHRLCYRSGDGGRGP
jgi:hypothetical protein